VRQSDRIKRVRNREVHCRGALGGTSHGALLQRLEAQLRGMDRQECVAHPLNVR
jgi:hypothetical protein